MLKTVFAPYYFCSFSMTINLEFETRKRILNSNSWLQKKDCYFQSIWKRNFHNVCPRSQSAMWRGWLTGGVSINKGNNSSRCTEVCYLWNDRCYEPNTWQDLQCWSEPQPGHEAKGTWLDFVSEINAKRKRGEIWNWPAHMGRLE